MIFINSESCITIDFSEFLNQKSVLGLKSFLEEKNILGWIEAVPTFHSLSIFFDPEVQLVSDPELQFFIKKCVDDYLSHLPEKKENLQSIIRIPVCYGGAEGPDIEWAASKIGISLDELIQVHTQEIYQVYMLGFVPGFPYLGDVPEKIRLPRMPQARSRVSAGSVGIAGVQTGIYPADIPGGWPIIGRTPVKIFDIEKEHPFLLSAGDFVQFYPITKEEFQDTNQHLT